MMDPPLYFATLPDFLHHTDEEILELIIRHPIQAQDVPK